MNPRTEQKEVEFRAGLTDAQSIAQARRLQVSLRLVGRQVAAIKPAAGPGPSGWRNSFIQLLYTDPAGPAALQGWAQAWASAAVAPWLVLFWSASMARPFWKDSHRSKIRPVLRGEALL